MPYRLEPELEAGQMVIDKRRSWLRYACNLRSTSTATLIFTIDTSTVTKTRFIWPGGGPVQIMLSLLTRPETWAIPKSSCNSWI